MGCNEVNILSDNFKRHNQKNIKSNLFKLTSVGILASALAACGTESGVFIIGNTTEDETLSAIFKISGATVDSYQWQRNGVDISGATQTTYALKQEDVGANITVTAKYTDESGTAETASSAATIAIVNVNDTPMGSVSISGNITEGDTLTANHNISDEDGLGTISYQWQRDGTDISGATDAIYELVNDDVGTAVRAVAKYKDKMGTDETVTSAATGEVEEYDRVEISSEIKEGETLTATVRDKEGLGTISYQWQRGGVDISGATNATYVLSADDVGSQIRVIASYTDGVGTAEVLTSNVSNIIHVDGVMNISELNGNNGFAIFGATKNDHSGDSVSSAGDVNGDGYADIIIGASPADYAGSNSGSGYVVFGKASGFAAASDLGDLDGTDGFRLDGASSSDYSSGRVSNAGDINGDGYDDLIVGARGADDGGSNSGSSYLIFGKADGFAPIASLADLNGLNGFRLDGGAAGDNSGWIISNAGDVNADGFDDLIIGAPYADDEDTNAGSSYVVFGKADGFSATMSLSALDGTNGYMISAEAAADHFGDSVANAGDVNGDGFDDVIIGARDADNGGSNSGSSYVVFGKADGFSAAMSANDLDGSNGFRLDGVNIDDISGSSVSSAGDVNGDGYDDLIIGAEEADNGNTDSGSSYVVFGKADGFGASMSLASLDGTTGFRIDGIALNEKSGISVSSAGDINNDGYDDMIIGAKNSSAYVLFGKLDGFDATIDLASLDGDGGFKIDGDVLFGFSVSSAGDVNGDGYDDLLVGDYLASGIAADTSIAGASYIIFGGEQFDLL